MEGHVPCQSGRCELKGLCKISCATVEQALSTLTSTDQRLLCLRSSIALSSDSFVCSAHVKRFLNSYAFFEIYCCNPFGSHKKNISKNLREVSLEQYTVYLESLGETIFPGKKLCTGCIKAINLKLQTRKDQDETNQIDDIKTPYFVTSPEEKSPFCTPNEFVLDTFNSFLTTLSLSPVKQKKGNLSSIHAYAREKFKSFTDTLETKIKQILELPEECNLKESSKVMEKSRLFDELMEELKQKIGESNRDKQMQYLTLVVNKLPKRAIMDRFQVSKRLVNQALELKQERGILEEPKAKSGRPLADEIVARVNNFYDDDLGLNSRILPGKKDRVKISKNEYKQKRLILCNLRELYMAYKEENPLDKVGFSKFCELRPKYCVLAGASGTHSICVCTIHQNFNLIIQSTKCSLKYKDLIAKIVCNIENRECMFLICQECPRETVVENILIKELFGYDLDADDDAEDEVEYKEWVATDRAELITKQCSKRDLISSILEKLKVLLPHMYIAKQQSQYLKQKKEKLSHTEALVLLDFSENFKYVVQDDIQQRYYNQAAVTLHPVIIYININGEVQHINICLFTEDLKHDVPVVKVFIDKIFEFIRERYNHIKSVEMFTDGCGGQYKNAEIFAYLPVCQKKFNLALKWNFFATSHGKSPCDGLGGLINRQAGRESLHRPFDDQIITLKALLDFCAEHILSIICISVELGEIAVVRENYKKEAKTIPGTRSFHQFTPHGESVIKCKRVSNDDKYCLLFNLKGKKISSWTVNTQVAFRFSDSWHIGVIIAIDEENLEVQISLWQMKDKHEYFPSFPPVNLSVPFPHVLCQVLLVQKRNHNLFTLNKTQLMKIENSFKKCQEESVIF